ncbi:MAG: coat protein [Cressdnaviricota sp.]|nr:MAG: coat protein [Cressdnaviricota sp.]
MHRRSKYGKKPLKKAAPKRAIVATVKSVIERQTEKKHYYNDFGASYSSASPDSNFVNLTPITQGAGDTQRIGDTTKPYSLYLSFGGGYTGTNAAVRILVFQWNQVTSPSISEILYSVTDGQDLVNSPISQDGLHAKKFRILMDKRIITHQYDPKISFVKRMSLKGCRQIGFMGGSTTAAGHIYMWIISDSGATTPPFITCNHLAILSDF